MAQKSMVYDHPTYLTRHCTVLKLPATTASTVAGKFIAFTAMTVKTLRLGVDIAGTSTGHYRLTLNGTGSLGVFQTLDSAAGYFPAVISSDIALTSGQFFDFFTGPQSATVAASVAIEYDILIGANVTA